MGANVVYTPDFALTKSTTYNSKPSNSRIRNIAHAHCGNLLDYFDSEGNLNKITDAADTAGVTRPTPVSSIVLMIRSLDGHTVDNRMNMLKHYGEFHAHFSWSKLNPWEDEEIYD